MHDQEPRDPSLILADLHASSKLIRHLKSLRDSGKFRSVSDALALQRAERERERLMIELGKPTLVT